MNKLIILSILAAGTVTAQQSNNRPIAREFENLLDNSNNYQEYKVVKQDDILELKLNTATFIDSLRTSITDLKSQIKAGEEAREQLQANLDAALFNIEELTQEKGSINFLGMNLEKGVYNTIIWSIIGILTVLLVFIGLQYKKSKAITDEARLEQQTAETELERYKAAAIEEKQRLGRQLQDERNKLAKLKSATS